ncbi:hypothetical protein [Liquorilactobacillus uvarum]|uniref:hypothetical protein n=1 Tax=Liquorilactobacillus uvarum TaxID=303240 RepID=UPI00288B7F9F|nr:hypothetical protein [Liquorilactobacillus uvarum]
MNNILKKSIIKKSFQSLRNDHLQNILGISGGDYKSGYHWVKAARNDSNVWSLC